ncbi:hypothetical protein GCM10023189_38190 [Nibrella saemangeumensis]|uniref:Secretion system C-terminal sorting domain-containing protein n=1 Tax=Nibrella saemangeumensis TaxID=1084526 RepID=A0ABP8N691_9BACT
MLTATLLVHPALGQQPLSLPFFDDFSLSPGRLDPARWVPGSGVYINNSMPINHPSVNVATFDGLNASGRPYNFNGVQTAINGPTDTLTSQPINLAGYNPADSVYLSFYWQRKGLGELPDVEDSLRLQFLGNDGQWRTVWKEAGGILNNNFTQSFVAVTDPRFLHAGFQFRIQSFDRQAGAFDSWHLDYVYMNRGRSQFDRVIKDVATRQAVSPYLKRYTAMPLRQYLANPDAETADSVTTDVNNLFNNFNFTTFSFRVQELVSGRTIQDEQQTLSVLIPSLSSQGKRIRPTPLTGVSPAGRAVLRYTFDVLTTDDQNPSIPTINLRRNDTISGHTVLDDYYAYDDGSAEIGIQINQRQSRAAMRFIANEPDAVTGVRICFLPYQTNQTGQLFALSVYANERGVPGSRALYQKSFTVRYPSVRNGFVEFKFDNPVAVKDTFYITFTQVNETPIPIGFDRNSPFSNQLLVNLSNRWEAYTDIRGVPMIRPVMGGTASLVVTGREEPLLPMQVYPNPTAGDIRWDNEAISRMEVLDLSGRLLYSLPGVSGRRTADLSHLTSGFYLLRLSDGKRTVVQKLVIQK